MYRRYHYNIIKERIQEPRAAIQVIAGPRQVGKTTVVTQVLNDLDINYISETADGVGHDNTIWISELWSSARSKMKFNNLSEFLIVVDEIQKIDNWSEYVKREWDYDSAKGINIKVVLLGSSRLLLKQGLTESLAGRFEVIRMGHWSFAEMRDAFGWNVSQYIYYGGYPQSARYVNNEKRWRAYMKDSIIEPIVGKDILMTTTIYKPALLRQLFALGCNYSGELLSLNKALGQLSDAGNITTLANYIRLLGDCQAVTVLQKYANDNARKYNSIPKFQVYNTALLSANAGRGFESEYTDPKRWGRWVESAVGARIVGSAEEVGYDVYYWRDGDLEVDFVLVKDGKIVALEVKSGSRTTNKGLPAFKDKYSPILAVVVGGEAISVEEFLLMDLERLWQ